MRSIQVNEQGSKSRRCLVILGWSTVSMLLLVAGSGCGHNKKEREAKKDDTLEVSTTTPKTQLLRRFILQPGILRSYEETPIYTKLAGYLKPFVVDIGDRITKDELIAELWVPEVDEAVRVKESKVDEGKADVTQAEETLKAADANIITWLARVKEAEASVIRAEALLVRWEEQFKQDTEAMVQDPKNPNKEWLKITDQSLAALRNENVPDSVLAKLKPMKGRSLSRDKFAEEITKLLSAGETKQFQTPILNLATRKIGYLDAPSVEETGKQRDASAAAVKETQAAVGSSKAALAESIAKRDRARADVQVNKTQLVVWERELEYQKRLFEYTRITAPYDGIVTRRIVHKGHMVNPANSGTTSTNAEPLFVVMRTDIIRVVIQVPEYDAPLVKDGADAVVRLQAYRGQDIKCKVERSSWALDKDARTLRVEIFLKNPAWINLNERVFRVLRDVVWFKVTDQVLAALKSQDVPEPVLAKLSTLKNKELSPNDFAIKLSDILKSEVWFKPTDQTFAALKGEKVPESVLAKLNPLKNKVFSRDQFVEEINKRLNAAEMKQYQDIILKRANMNEMKQWETLILSHARKNLPAAVLAKLSPLKDKELSQEDFVKELAKVLNADEREQYQDMILKRGDSPVAPMKLQAGMYGNVSITADIPNALTLPSQAILTDGNKKYCFIIEDGKARRVNVNTGITNDTITEIMTKQAPPTKLGEEGVWVKFTGSEQVVTSNLTSIQDGQPVKAK